MRKGRTWERGHFFALDRSLKSFEEGEEVRICRHLDYQYLTLLVHVRSCSLLTFVDSPLLRVWPLAIYGRLLIDSVLDDGESLVS
jgi:hypothetical protein